VTALALATGVFSASCGDSGARVPDAGTPEDDAGTPDTPGMETMAGLRFMHASPLAGDLDIYLHGETTPLFAGMVYGKTSARSPLPPGTYQLDVRPAGKSETIRTSDPITVTAGGSVTAVGTGVVTTDPNMLPPPTTAFRIISLADGFAPAAPGKTRVRIVNTVYSTAALAVDVGDDGTPEIASLARFAASDAAGIEVTAGSELVLGIQTADAGHSRVGSFVVPGSALGDGADVHVIVTGLTTFPARDPRSAAAVVVPAPGNGATLNVRPDPVVYLLAASPDASGLDAYLGTRKLFSGLTFGKLGAAVVRSTTTGYTLDFRPAGSTTLLRSRSTGALEAGQQYLAVVTGLVSPTSDADALSLGVYRDDMLDVNDFGRIRVVNAAVGAGPIDAGRYPAAGWIDVTDFDAIPTGAASHPFGTAVDPTTTPGPVILGARLAANPALALRFDTMPALAQFDRLFGVFAGAWSPVGNQVPARYIVVKTAAITPWTTTVLSPIPTAIEVTPATANLVAGETQQYTATAVFGNGTTQLVTPTATWKSLNTAIAQMSTPGLATAVAAGTTSITAKLGTVTGTAAITVTGAQVPAVSAIQPGEGASGVDPTTSIAVTFNQAIAPATLSAQTQAGACAGTLQLSSDGFLTCVGFMFSAPAMNTANTIATFQPAAPLATQTTYRLRVSGTVTNAGGVAIGTDVTQATGFTITCAGKLVISQVYGGGSAASGVYRNDFIELHNSGGSPVDLTGYVLQSGIANLTTWTAQALSSAIIPPGGYLLIKEAGGTSMSQLELPAPDVTPANPFSLNGMNGKVALTLSATGFTVACPLTSTPPLPTTDLVGYGTTANCFEGAAATAVLTNATAAIRNDDGCLDNNVNSTDFTVTTPAPRNSTSPIHLCSCPN
jgi:hypothetical protein